MPPRIDQFRQNFGDLSDLFGFDPQADQQRTDAFTLGNQQSAQNIRDAFAASQVDQRNVIDKYQPIAEAIGFLIDKSSGNRSTRRLANENLKKVQQSRQDRVAGRTEKARKRFLDQVGVEELTGKLRGQSFSAQTGVTERNLRGSAATANAANAVTPKDATPLNAVQARQKRINEEADTIMADLEKSGKSFSSLSEIERSKVEAGGYRLPPSTDQQMVELYGEANKEASAVFGDIRKEAYADLAIAKTPQERQAALDRLDQINNDMGLFIDDYLFRFATSIRPPQPDNQQFIPPIQQSGNRQELDLETALQLFDLIDNPTEDEGRRRELLGKPNIVSPFR